MLYMTLHTTFARRPYCMTAPTTPLADVYTMILGRVSDCVGDFMVKNITMFPIVIVACIVNISTSYGGN